MNLTTIHNIGELYSHHYLDALLEKDLRGLFARWQNAGPSVPVKVWPANAFFSKVGFKIQQVVNAYTAHF